MIIRIGLLLLLSVVFFVPCFADENDAVGSTNLVEAFTLKDQHKDVHKQVFPKQKISVYALADRKGSDQLEDWITPFYKAYEDRIDICGVANLKGVPKMLQPMIRSLFRKGVDYPVMMDWTGEVCEAFGYRAGEADIFIVSSDGQVLHRVSGKATEDKLLACYAIIDALVEPEGKKDDDSPKDAGRKESDPQAPEATSDEPPPES